MQLIIANDVHVSVKEETERKRASLRLFVCFLVLILKNGDLIQAYHVMNL
jgi:hypothetical protein